MHTVEDVADRLRINRRTVLRLIHDGALMARKVGRQWRVSAEALRELTGPTSSEPAVARSSRTTVVGSTPLASRSRASSVVEIHSMERDEADRIANSIMAGMKSRTDYDQNGRFDYMYDHEEKKARYVVWGSLSLTRDVFAMMAQLA